MLFDFPKKVLTYLFGVSIIRGEYWWERGERRLIANLSELEVLQEIHDLRGHGWSYNGISQKLNNLGILSKMEGKWYSSSVRSVYINVVIVNPSELKVIKI